MFTLHKSTLINTTIEEAWDFIRNPGNLNLITPEKMDFKIKTQLSDEMVEGMMIEYRVTIPYLGKRKWVSEIKNIIPKHSFVDEQREGPYKHWHHHHIIEPHEGGVLFTDKITYLPPFGPLGKMANTLFIRAELERIFEYRERSLVRILAA